MKELIPMNEYGIFADKKDNVWVDSRYVAQAFEKQHKDVLRTIRLIVSDNSGYSNDFTGRNFALSSYIDTTGRKLPCYNLTRDGFVALVMAFSGKKADHFRELYIKRFDEMESFIKTLVAVRQDFPELTEHIKLLHKNPKPYHYSNECDMINRIVLGKSAKQFREEHGIEKGQSIRPYLNDEQLNQIESLQKVDIGLMIAIPDFNKRNDYLNWYKIMRYENKLLD